MSNHLKRVILILPFIFGSLYGTAAEYINPKDGVVYVYKDQDGQEISNRVLGSTKDSFLVESAQRGPYELLASQLSLIKRENATISTEDRSKALALFPLKVGNKVEFEYERDAIGIQGRSKKSVTSTVLGTEKVKSPLGDLDTYVIETIQLTPPVFENRNKCWYAPGIGLCVKYEATIKSPVAQNNRIWTGDMVRYSAP